MFRTALLLFAVGAAAPSEQRTGEPVDSRVSCGGVTEVATVKRYFSHLREALGKTSPKARFNIFVNEQFGVRDKQGRTLYFKVRDIGSVTPGRITLEEWREISRRGAQSLHNAGWRGCFLDNGKVWFVGSKEDGFRLTFIKKDMPWVRPEKGGVVP